MDATFEDPPEPAAGEAAAFAAECARLKASGVLGEGGRLAELFDFLAGRGAASEPATQVEIAETVFGQAASESDDATVRVYIHRLRKRLEEFYAQGGEEGSRGRLTIPSGTYALRFVTPPVAEEDQSVLRDARKWLKWAIPALLCLLVLSAFFLGRATERGAPEVNAIWRPFLESDRPIVVVVGDYYIFGEIDPMNPEAGRLIRDFAINSKTDLARAQESDPEHYEMSEDMGLNYLPFSSAYGLSELMPILSQHRKPVTIIPASQVTSDTFQTSNVVYIGLISGMGLLEDVNFMNSGFAVGESYDELVDNKTRKSYISEEALSLASAKYYRDYGYFTEFHEPGGALVAVVAGARDTGLRGLAPIVAAGELSARLEKLVKQRGRGGVEAIYEITGQQGADLSEKLVAAQQRP
ncbi:MAG TPA: helix-turn-helix domain-containing protein [Sphingomonadaceae bacterium]|nr:helix-turn-helix domain-containing protein [Sphingomonadaceae bacterium]